MWQRRVSGVAAAWAVWTMRALCAVWTARAVRAGRLEVHSMGCHSTYGMRQPAGGMQQPVECGSRCNAAAGGMRQPAGGMRQPVECGSQPVECASRWNAAASRWNAAAGGMRQPAGGMRRPVECGSRCGGRWNAANSGRAAQEVGHVVRPGPILPGRDPQPTPHTFTPTGHAVEHAAVKQQRHARGPKLRQPGVARLQKCEQLVGGGGRRAQYLQNA
eukprot:353421-Chlamydomonas_euryale.AAC.1